MLAAAMQKSKFQSIEVKFKPTGSMGFHPDQDFAVYKRALAKHDIIEHPGDYIIYTVHIIYCIIYACNIIYKYIYYKNIWSQSLTHAIAFRAVNQRFAIVRSTVYCIDMLRFTSNTV